MEELCIFYQRSIRCSCITMLCFTLHFHLVAALCFFMGVYWVGMDEFLEWDSAKRCTCMFPRLSFKTVGAFIFYTRGRISRKTETSMVSAQKSSSPSAILRIPVHPTLSSRTIFYASRGFQIDFFLTLYPLRYDACM